MLSGVATAARSIAASRSSSTTTGGVGGVGGFGGVGGVGGRFWGLATFGGVAVLPCRLVLRLLRSRTQPRSFASCYDGHVGGLAFNFRLFVRRFAFIVVKHPRKSSSLAPAIFGE